MVVGLAATLLGLISVPVLAAARSPRLAEQIVRLPRGLRAAARQRPTAARTAFTAVWVAMWCVALGVVGAGTQKPLVGVAVGAVVGVFVGAAAAMAMTFALHGWEADALGRHLSPPAPIATVSAADLAAPGFSPAFPAIMTGAGSRAAWSRTERAMRWGRNVCATLFVVVMMLARAATVHGDGTAKTALGLIGLALVLTAVAAYGALAFVRRARERRVLDGQGAVVSVAAVCAAHGWTSGSLDARVLRGRWPGVRFFADDKDHRVRAFIRGSLGPYDLCIIDERGTPPGSSSVLMRETRQTVYVISLPGTRLPRLSVLARHARYLPHQRVNRTLELEAFNRMHHVACADPAFASAVLTPRMMSLLMAQLQPGAQVVMSGDALAVVVPGRLRLSLLEATVASLADAVRLMPTYLLRQFSTVSTSSN